MDEPTAPAATAPATPRSALLKLYDSNRPAAALLTLVVLEIVPVLGLIASAREGWDAWTTPAAGLAVAGLIGPAGILLGRGWGVIATSYVSWAGIVLVVLQAMTLGLSPLRLAPAAAYAAVLATLSSLSRNEDAGRKGVAAADLPMAAWLKENIEAIIVAFIMALVIRCFGIEVFKIPSSSMEPTLLGDVGDRHSRAGCGFPNVHVTNGGDRIMVTKFFYAAADIERYDVVVFKFPLNQSRNFIKRVVGLPDEELLLYHGNIFTRKPGEKEKGFRIARRPSRTQDSLWIDPAGVKTFLDSGDGFDKYWEVEGPRPAVAHGDLGYLAPPPGGVKFRFKNALEDADRVAVSDLRIAFEATLTSAQGEIFAEILNAYGRFELRLFADRDGELRRYAAHDDKGAHPVAQMPLRRRLDLDQRVRVELGVYDGLAYARVDGEEPRIEFIKTREAMDPLLSGEPSIRFGGAGGAFRVRNLKVGRDVHHKQGRSTGRFEEDKPVRIRPGHYVVMGDNVTSSHDSRGWVQRGYSLVGREEVVEYEGQQEFDPDVTESSIQERYGLKVTPTRLIADKYGRIWALYQDDPGPLPAGVPAGVIDETRSIKDKDFYEIGEQFIVGKALWVWWPPGRWFKLIR